MGLFFILLRILVIEGRPIENIISVNYLILNYLYVWNGRFNAKGKNSSRAFYQQQSLS